MSKIASNKVQKKNIKIRAERTIHVYADLWHASRCVLEKGIEDKTGSFWQFLSSITLSAFAFEAFLNYAGSHSFVCWNELERKLSVDAKLALLCEEFDLVFCKSKRPMQTCIELFIFRNTIAHGKSEYLEDTFDVNPSHIKKYAQDYLSLDWENKVKDEKFAKRVREDLKAIMQTIYEKLPQPKDSLFSHGLQMIGSSA